MDCQGEMASLEYLALKENQPKRASRVSVGHLETLVLLGHQERGVHLAYQASVDQEKVEKRAARGDQASLELLDHLVQKVSQVKV